MYSRVTSAALIGLDAHEISIEVDIARGVPQILVVGLPDTAVNEARERVKSAIRATGFDVPNGRIVVNMAPADIRKEGSHFDLGIAVGILISSGQQKPISPQSWLVGELGLNGEVRSINGVLAMAHSARENGVTEIIVPKDNAKEAALIEGIEVYGAATLQDALDILYGDINTKHKYYVPTQDFQLDAAQPYKHDVKYVKGQYQAKRALELSAAGGHNLLMVGEPGSGKSMLANCLPSIMPPLTKEMALEVTKIYSIAGLLSTVTDSHVVTHRMFRSPHHSISAAGLIGGGSNPKPGEISLSHHGVLFLDELAEFDKKTLDQLRQPIESGEVAISRVRFSVQYPCRFLLIGACNPTTGTSKRSHAIISAPLWDRFGLIVWVPALKSQDLINFEPDEQVSSADIRRRVARAWDIQRERFGASQMSNAHMTPKEIKQYCILSKGAESLLQYAAMELDLTGRTYDHVLRVARTIADLDLYEEIEDEHIAEAIQYRISQQNILSKA